MEKISISEEYNPEYRLGWAKANLSIDDKLSIESSFAALAYEDDENNSWKKANAMNLFTDYELLESPNIFTKRRYLYNKNEGASLLLNGKNSPIYEIADKTKFLAPKQVESFLENELDEICKKYILFLFGHVEGSHGPFLICENLDDLLCYLKKYYEEDENKDKLEKFNQLSTEQKQELKETTQEALDLIYSNVTTKTFGLNQKEEDIIKEDSMFRTEYEAYMLFKATLFKSDIIIETNLENKDTNKHAIISMTNQSMLIPDFRNNKGEIENNPYKSVNDVFQKFGYSEFLPPLHLLELT